jgi:hypothetical protein
VFPESPAEVRAQWRANQARFGIHV